MRAFIKIIRSLLDYNIRAVGESPTERERKENGPKFDFGDTPSYVSFIVLYAITPRIACIIRVNVIKTRAVRNKYAFRFKQPRTRGTERKTDLFNPILLSLLLRTIFGRSRTRGTHVERHARATRAVRFSNGHIIVARTDVSVPRRTTRPGDSLPEISRR